MTDFKTADASCSTYKLMSAVEFVVLKENSELMDKIGKNFGPLLDAEK